MPRVRASGGTYLYGRAHLGELWGYIADWDFVAGKTASCAALALAVVAYAAPGLGQLPRGPRFHGDGVLEAAGLPFFAFADYARGWPRSE
ncbi:hypothetical protein GCM10027360_50510 [Amycolatopsis echigonensis]